MAKTDDLINEVKKFTSAYSDILTGMHADLNDYKKRVSTQKTHTTKTLNKVENLLEEVNSLKSTIDNEISIIHKTGERFKKYNSEIYKLRESYHKGLNRFNLISQELRDEIQESKRDLSKKINDVNNKTSDEIDSLDDRFKNEIKLVKDKTSEEIKSVNNSLFGEISALKQKNKQLIWFSISGFIILGSMIALQYFEVI